jgi:phosphopantothenoylcysteine decarboxylase/phosphopantothenate--cysteine ligase
MRMLITAGPTREPIDAVRFISNRSSGRVGLALAEAAAEAGHAVTLLLGPVLASASLGERVRVERFSSTQDLRVLLREHFEACDALVMAAAVADYRPIEVRPGKLPRSVDGGRLFIELEPTPDLVAEVAASKRADQAVVAFSLEEPARLVARAREKLRRKEADAIVANPLATMDAGQIEPTLFTADGRHFSPGRMSKAAFGRWLVGEVERLTSARRLTSEAR